MGLETNVSLIVATLDLQVVQLLRGAIRAADRAARIPPGDSGIPPAARFEPRRTIEPEPRYEPRPVIHPRPRFEPRPVHRALESCPDLAPACSAPCAAEKSRITPSPIQPPWKVLPWENPPPPAQVVKVVIHRPDYVNKGSIIDCFI